MLMINSAPNFSMHITTSIKSVPSNVFREYVSKMKSRPVPSRLSFDIGKKHPVRNYICKNIAPRPILWFFALCVPFSVPCICLRVKWPETPCVCSIPEMKGPDMTQQLSSSAAKHYSWIPNLVCVSLEYVA